MGRPRIRVEPQPGGVQLVIAARDRLGLFSDTAGLLASHSVQVRSAVLHTVEGVAVNTWRVDKQAVSDLPDTAYLVKQLSRLEAGEAGILNSVQRREARAHSSGAVPNPYWSWSGVRARPRLLSRSGRQTVRDCSTPLAGH